MNQENRETILAERLDRREHDVRVANGTDSQSDDGHSSPHNYRNTS